MSIRNCRVIAIDGPQGSGKTTLVYALCAALKVQHKHVAPVAEATRLSMYMEDSIFLDKPIDIFTELHILGSAIKLEHDTARNHEIIICDRSIINIVAYSKLLISSNANPFTLNMIEEIQNFCIEYRKIYDLVLFLDDRYNLSLTNDPFRAPHTGQTDPREGVSQALRNAYSECGVELRDIETGLPIDEKVALALKLIAEIL